MDSLRQEIMGKMDELAEKYKDDQETLRQERRKLYRSVMQSAVKVPLSVLVDHVDHVVEVAGIDYVGLGSDFDGISAAQEKLDDVSDIVWIVVELKKRGYSEADIRKILGENFLRVIKANTGS